MLLLVRQSRDKGPHQCRLELKEASRCLLQQFPLKFGTLFFLLLSPKSRVLPVRAIIQINSELAPFTGRRGLLDRWSGWQAAEPNVGDSFLPYTEGFSVPWWMGTRLIWRDVFCHTAHNQPLQVSMSADGRRDDKVIYLQSSEFSFLSLQTNVQVKCAVRNVKILPPSSSSYLKINRHLLTLLRTFFECWNKKKAHSVFSYIYLLCSDHSWLGLGTKMLIFRRSWFKSFFFPRLPKTAANDGKLSG